MPRYRNMLADGTVCLEVARYSRCELKLSSVDPRRDFGTVGRRLSSQDTRHSSRAIPTGISQNAYVSTILNIIYIFDPLYTILISCISTNVVVSELCKFIHYKG